MAIALIAVVSLGVIGALEDGSGDRLNERASTAGGGGESLGVLPSGSGGGGGSGEPPPGGGTTYTASVDDLIGSASQGSPSSKWIAQVQITIADENGDPIAGITVSGSWDTGTGPSTTISCVTETNGTCSVQRTGINDNSPTATFTISGMTSTDPNIVVNYTVPSPPDAELVECAPAGVC